MFDPFKDFVTAGYLRNVYGEKDPEIIREMEHELFRAGIDDALAMLSKRKVLSYRDFLEVHAVLFSELYPWAGQDRRTTAPESAISKANTWFCDPRHCQLAVEEGLRLGQDREKMRRHFGEVMGLFAYGHPFLDGNGRTMLLVHTELSDRAGFAIAWQGTDKAGYLRHLSAEIEKPGKGILDGYLEPFVIGRMERKHWGEAIRELNGLGGTHDEDSVEGNLSDPDVSRKYRAFDQQRAYRAK